MPEAYPNQRVTAELVHYSIPEATPVTRPNLFTITTLGSLDSQIGF